MYILALIDYLKLIIIELWQIFQFKKGRDYTRTRPEFRFQSGPGSGEICDGTGYCPVQVDLASTRLVPRFLFMFD